MKNIFVIICYIIITFISMFDLQAQTYQFYQGETIICKDTANNVNINLLMNVTIDMVYQGNIECGNWQFDANFVFSDYSVNPTVILVDWVNVTDNGGIDPNQMYNTSYGETEHGAHTTFHISEPTADIKLFFKIRLDPPYTANCPDYNFEYIYSIAQNETCQGCVSAFCYSHTFCMYEEPYTNQLKTIYYYNGTNPVQQTLSATSNPGGIFNFPYNFYSGDCLLMPDLYDFVDDMNTFLDATNSGHCVLQYVEDATNCKIWIKVKDSDFVFDYASCKSYKLDNCVPNTSYQCPGTAVGLVINGSCKNLALENMGLEGTEKEYLMSKDPHFDWSVYPMASADFIRISFTNMESANKTLKLIDLSGSTLQQLNLSSDSNDIKFDISHLPSGIYYIQLMYEGTNSIKKIIKL